MDFYAAGRLAVDETEDRRTAQEAWDDFTCEEFAEMTDAEIEQAGKDFTDGFEDAQNGR